MDWSSLGVIVFDCSGIYEKIAMKDFGKGLNVKGIERYLSVLVCLLFSLISVLYRV